MAKANPSNLNNQPPEPLKGGPEIEYVGEGAKEVVFTIHPKARKYVVHATGQVLETF